MISNRDMIIRIYKKQQNIDPDTCLPSSKISKIPVKQIKPYVPKKISTSSRYGNIKIDNKEE